MSDLFPLGLALVLTTECGDSSNTSSRPVGIPDTTALTDTRTDADGLALPPFTDEVRTSLAT